MSLFVQRRILSTPGARDAFEPLELVECLRRHSSGDWGDLDHHDREANDRALKTGERLLSAYELTPRKEGGARRKLWIITEAEDDEGVREATTLLLPEEY